MIRALGRVLFAGALLAPAEAFAWCASRSGAGQSDPSVCPAGGAALRWRERCAGYVVNVSVLPEGFTAFATRETVAAAARAWGGASCDASTGAPPGFVLRELTEEATSVGYLAGARNQNTVNFRMRWGGDAAHRAGVMALTTVSYDADSGQIFDADTELNLRSGDNPEGFVFSVTGAPDAADLQTVVTHEFGHAQGLAHSDRSDAVMWPSAGRSFARRALSVDDASGVCAVHGGFVEGVCDPAAASAPREVTAGCGCEAAGSVRGGGWGLLVAGLRPRRRRRP